MTFRPLSLALYGLATHLAEPLAPALLRRRARRGKEDEARLGERLGAASVDRPAGPLVWLHGVSVGESLSLLPLAAGLRHLRPDIAVLVTSGTLTAAQLIAGRAPAGVIHQYIPVDAPGAVGRFLDHWRPDLGVLAESELWPNLIQASRRRGVRLALVSARITARTAKAWSRDRGAARTLLAAFDLILAQDEASAARLAALGGRVDGRLNLKLVGEPLAADEAELARLRALIGERPVVLAASTHAPEETLIAGAMERLARNGAPALLILAPRHPDRGADVAAELTARGRRTARRQAGEAPGLDTEVYVADTLGEMGLFFRLAEVAIMGGSFFSGVGGHNPLEPARLGAPIVVGGHVANFAEVYAAMLEAGAAVRAEGEDELAAAIGALHRDPERRRRMADAARAFAETSGGELDAALARLAPLLPAP